MTKTILLSDVQVAASRTRPCACAQGLLARLVVFGLTSVLGACTQARLLSPLCEQTAWHMPPGFEGLYALSLPIESGFVDNLPTITDLGVVIKKSASGHVEITLATVDRGSANVALLGAMSQPIQHVLCRVDSRFFLSSETGLNAGTPASGHTVAELVVGDDGIQILPVQVDAKRAREAGFPMFFAPGFGFSRAVESGGSGSFDVTSQLPSVLLVANNPGAPAATLGVMRRLSTSLYLRRLEETSFLKRFRQRHFRMIGRLSPAE